MLGVSFISPTPSLKAGGGVSSDGSAPVNRVHAVAMSALHQSDADTCRWCKDYVKRMLSKLTDESDDEQGMIDVW